MYDFKEETPKNGEAEPFIKGRDQLEADQLLKVLHEVFMPTLEDKVAQADAKRILSDSINIQQ
eukprot:5097271-Prorocentrum_lima.AAC.1